MPGLYDWYKNSLLTDQSPMTNQLSRPIGGYTTPLPVPFQITPGESSNPLSPVTNMFSNLQVPNVPPMESAGITAPPTGNNPMSPMADPIRSAIIQKFISGLGSGKEQPKPQALEMTRLGNAMPEKAFTPLQTQRPGIDDRLKFIQQQANQRLGMLAM